MSDTKHGWVSPRADGLMARCGGPGICATCDTEREHDALYELKHGLSQDAPGPLEPVEIAQQPGAAPATGNTARDQEMYAAGIRTGEENTKHNAAIRAGAAWLPIESAPKDGTEFQAWLHVGLWEPRCRFNPDSEAFEIWGRVDYDRDDWDACGHLTATHWMPKPAAPGVSTVEDASFPSGAIVNGRTLADRLEAYPFESQGGDLRLCSDWVEFRRCFEYLSEWVGSRAPAAGDALTAAVRDVLAERRHQVEIGYDAEHDDAHVNDEIAAVACYYLMPPGAREWPATETGYGDTLGKAIIPEGWHADDWQDRRRQLVMGVAMGLAEIERLDRAAIAAQQGKGGA